LVSAKATNNYLIFMAKYYNAPVTEIVRFETARLCGLLDGSDLDGPKNGGLGAPRRKVYLS